MRFEETGLDGLQVDYVMLTEALERIGFVHAGQWDYERVTYDYKFEILHEVYYLRVQGFAIEGEIGSRYAVVQLLTPILGKHYYPHGVEYGDGEKFPESVVSHSNELLKRAFNAISTLPKV